MQGRYLTQLSLRGEDFIAKIAVPGQDKSDHNNSDEQVDAKM